MGEKNNIINTLVASGFIPNNVAALEGKCTLFFKKEKGDLHNDIKTSCRAKSILQTNVSSIVVFIGFCPLSYCRATHFIDSVRLGIRI